MKLSLDLLDELVCELKAKNAKAAAPKPPEIDKYAHYEKCIISLLNQELG